MNKTMCILSKMQVAFISISVDYSLDFFQSPLIFPVRVDVGQLSRDPVVFTQPERVHGRQPGLLVGPGVAGSEAVKVGRGDSAHLVRGGKVERGQERFSEVQVRVLQFACPKKFSELKRSSLSVTKGCDIDG